MIREEAMKLVSKEYPDMELGKVTETKKYFVIHISPKNAPKLNGVELDVCDDGLKAVDKKTGQMFTYNPMLHRE